MQSGNPTYSLIVPTFGRTDEVTEFLDSLTHSRFKNFEVIVADGTPGKSLEEAVSPFCEMLSIQFLYRDCLPVSDARNWGAKQAKSNWFIFLDSDCIIPSDYLTHVDEFLQNSQVDAFGGPDSALDTFTPIQKAISYAMTSFFTTGGIRGNKKHIGTFHPRGFNMGISKQAFETVKGYDTSFLCGEDIDLSIRVLKAGFRSALIPNAFVYHKRRTNFKKFFKQVTRFGAARINLYVRHREELSVLHLFPLVFSLYLLLGSSLFLASSLLGFIWFGSIAFYTLLILVDASIQNKNILIGLLSVRASFTQLLGYGWGFLRNAIEVFIKGNKKGIKL
ncbi:MAG: glycosyltransferase [Flavobacteriales bacterium]|nr:glycosyltransferase [Flavobacteriales bacterium]